MKLVYHCVVGSILFLFIADRAQAQAPDFAWAKRAGGTSYDYGEGIAVDRLGNSFVTGYFQSPTITFGSTVLTNHGDADAYVVKYDASGNVRWAASVGGINIDLGLGIAVDSSGASYITGEFYSPTITIGRMTLTNRGYTDMFIVKFDAAGNVVWAKSAGNSSYDFGYSVAVDKSGGCYVMGGFDSPTITFDSTTLTNSNNYTNLDMFVVKYDVNGDVVWAKSAGGANDEISRGIAVDNFGNSYVTGFFTSPLLSVDSQTVKNNGIENIFILKFDRVGNVVWAKSVGGSTYDEALGIVTDDSGNCYVTGGFKSPAITFGRSTLTNNGGDDIFVAKFDGNGNVIWAKSAGGADDEDGQGIAVDRLGNSYITGFFYSSQLTIGSTTLTCSGSDDIFIAKYDAGGNVVWAQSAGDSGDDYGSSIAVDGIGNGHVTGWYYSSRVFFGSTELKNGGGNDIFVAAISPTTGISENVNLFPTGFSLSQNYPNPFNPSTTLTFSLPSKSFVSLKIFDILGEEVSKLISEELSAGIYSREWTGTALTSGVYFYRLQAGSLIETKKLILLR